MPLQTDETTLPGQIIVFDDTNGGVAIDYSSYFERIASSLERVSGEDSTLGLERIATQLEALSGSLQQISGEDSTLGLERIATQLEALSGSLQQISGEDSTLGLERIVNILEEFKNLAAGPGIRTLSPYETFSAIAIYKLFVEEGKILQFLDGEATDEQKIEAINKISEYINKVKNDIPKDF